MAEVMVGASLRDCRVRDGPDAMRTALVRRFVDEASRFRMYASRQESLQTVDRPLKASELTPDFWNREPGPMTIPPGSPALGGRAGESQWSVTWGFRAAYRPNPSTWTVQPDRAPTRNVFVTATGRPGIRLQLGWHFWDLKCGFEFWELVDYWQVKYDGPSWGKGESGIQEGLAEAYMQDLLAKAVETYADFQPSFVHIGADFPGVRNAYQLFNEERKIPRISWTNIFGPTYVEKYGRRFLLDAPGHRMEELGDGSILYQVTPRFFLTERDLTGGPTVEEVEGYFKGHPQIKRILYRPVPLAEFVSRGKARGAGRADAARIATWADEAISVFSDRLGVLLDNSPESLRRLDEAISEHFEEGEEPLPTTLLPLGAYVGEVLRIALGGRWNLREPIVESTIEDLPGGGSAYPFQRVLKRFLEGRSASLHDWYVVMAKIES